MNEDRPAVQKPAHGDHRRHDGDRRALHDRRHDERAQLCVVDDVAETLLALRRACDSCIELAISRRSHDQPTLPQLILLKRLHHHTGYIGNLKSIPLQKMLDDTPERVIEHAVKGMLPRGPLGRRMFAKLRVFAGPEHTHSAQQPIPLEVNA